MKIALVTETYRPEINGVAMTLGHLVDTLGTKGHQVTVYRPRQHPNDHHQPHEVTLRGVPIPGYPGLHMGLPSTRRLRRYWSAPEFRPDLVHIATEGLLGWSALRAAKQLGIPRTSGFHTNFHAYGQHYGFAALQRATLIYLRWFHNQTAATFAPTAEICESLTKEKFERMRVMGRGVDLELFNPERRDPLLRQSWVGEGRGPVVIYVGRIAAEKNLALALSSFQAMQRVQPDCRMVMVGDGPLLKKLKRSHPEILFCGAQQGVSLAAHYASADIFLFPSLTETFGNVVTEAMASGLAVVAFDYAAARQCIKHDHNGLVAPYGSSEAFTEAALSLVRPEGPSPSGQSRDLSLLRAAARMTASRLSWQQVVSDFEDALREIAMGHAHHPSTVHLSKPALSPEP